MSTLEEREANRRHQAKYRKTETYRKWLKKHLTSPISKEKRRAYFTTERYKEWRKAYHKTKRMRRYTKEYRQTPAYKKRMSKYARDRMAKDPLFKLQGKLRGRLASIVRQGACRPASALRLVGCTLPELKAHLESSFAPGMGWGNWGRRGWHVDHVRPLVSFDLTQQEEVRKAMHYSNLQPLWAVDNLKKGGYFTKS